MEGIALFVSVHTVMDKDYSDIPLLHDTKSSMSVMGLLKSHYYKLLVVIFQIELELFYYYEKLVCIFYYIP